MKKKVKESLAQRRYRAETSPREERNNTKGVFNSYLLDFTEKKGKHYPIIRIVTGNSGRKHLSRVSHYEKGQEGEEHRK